MEEKSITSRQNLDHQGERERGSATHAKPGRTKNHMDGSFNLSGNVLKCKNAPLTPTLSPKGRGGENF
jgi:hypothetical protein